MRTILLPVLALFAACAARAEATVPTGDLTGWKNLAFDGIPANAISTDDGQLTVAVENSSSPLVYRFGQPMRIVGIEVEASWAGELQVPDDAMQGERGADDFVLKVGVIESGDRRLNWFQRRIAADWIKQLYALAPEGSGIDRIRFLSTTQSAARVGDSRVHPLSELLHETRVTHLEAPGRFRISHRFPEPVESLGLWLASDGDDTKSSFVVTIDSIRLETADDRP